MVSHFKRDLIISFSIIAGSIAVFGTLFYFLSQDLYLQSGKISADRSIINQRAATIDSLNNLKKDAPNADVYLKAMNKLLVPQDQLFDFSRWLDGIARVRQVGMSFHFNGNIVSSQGNSPSYIAFSLDLNGGIQNLLDFLKDVEFRSPRFLVRIDNFDFTKNDRGYRILSNGRVFFK